MSKMMIIPLLLLVLLLTGALAASAEFIPLEPPMYMSAGQVMVPIAVILQWLGAEVEYDEANYTLTARYGDEEFQFRAAERHALVNGETTTIDPRPSMEWSHIELSDGQLFVPLRFLDARSADGHTPEPSLVAQAIGFQISWDTTSGGFATLTLNEDEEGERTATIAYRPLHWAAGQGHSDMVEQLLDEGLDVNALTSSGWTSLHWAAREGRSEVVELLLERGAEINLQCNAGWVPLHWAAHRGRTGIVRMLIERGADPQVADLDGELPLLWAARHGHEDVVEILLDNGADVNAANNVGVTALHNATAHNRGAVVELLLERGAEVNARTRCGITPLYWAERRYHEELAELLREHGAET